MLWKRWHLEEKEQNDRIKDLEEALDEILYQVKKVK